jgi:hypothetical protein
MMANAGYFHNDPLMLLVQRKWYLRAIANSILDQAIHVDGMSREEAMRLMIEETFQEEREAAGKWIRAQLTSTQLSPISWGCRNISTCGGRPRNAGAKSSRPAVTTTKWSRLDLPRSGLSGH